MYEPDEEIDGVWNSWSATCEVAVIMDGKKLNDVFSAIRTQLDFLRRQHHGLSEKFENFANNQQHDHQLISNLMDHTQSQKELPVSPPSDTAKQNDPHTDIQNNNYQSTKGSVRYIQAPPVEQILDAEELQIMLDRIHTLEQDVRRHEGFGERLDKLEANVNSKFNAFQSQVDKLNARVDATSAMELAFEKKFADLEDRFNARIDQLSQAVEDKTASDQRNTQDNLAAQKAELSNLNELILLNELRIKKAENDLVRTSQVVTEVQETVDYFPVKYLDSIRNDIIELYMVKAGKDELNNKVDVSNLQSKADADEVHRLEQHTLELLRRLDLHAKEMHEGFASVDGKLDKRIDKVAHWCLKHLRREFKNNGGHDDARDGADIGKVKCLVCDQVVIQHTETEIVHGGPPMKNVIKPYHTPLAPNQTYHNQQPQYNQQYQQQQQHSLRPRSASPPPSRGKGYGTGATPAVPQYGERFQPGYTYGHTETVNMPKIKSTNPGTLPSVNHPNAHPNAHPNTATTTSTTANPLSKNVKLAPVSGTTSPKQPNPVTTNPILPSNGSTHNASGNNNNGVEFNEDVEHPEEFNFRVETDVGAPNQGGSSPANANINGTNANATAQAQKAAAQEGPMRISHAHLHGNNNNQGHSSGHHTPVQGSSATQAILQQQMLQLNVQQDGNYHFRDLEE